MRRVVFSAVIAALITFSATGVGAIPTTLTVGTPVPVGACQVDIPIIVSTSLEVTYAQFVLDFGSGCLTYVSTQLGANAPAMSGWQISVNYVDNGTNFRIANAGGGIDRHVLVQVLTTGTGFTGSNQEIVKLRFNVAPGIVPCALLWDDLINTSTNTWPTNLVSSVSGIVRNPPDMTLVDGSISGFCLEVQGQVRYWNPATPAFRIDTNADVEVCGDQGPPTLTTVCDVADVMGNYLLRGYVPTGSGMPAREDVILRADKPTVPSRDFPPVSGFDAVALFRHAAALPPPFSVDQARAGDVNQDTMTNLTDAIAVTQWLAFIFHVSNKTGDWVFNFRHETAMGGPVETQNTRSFPIGPTVNPEIVNVRTFLLGDVSGHWPNPPKINVPSQVGLSFAAVEWQGDEVLVRLMADVGQEGLQTLIYSLDYDGAELTFLSAESGERTGDFYLVDNPATAGVLHGVAIGWQQTQMQSGEILRLRFRAPPAMQQSSLSFSRLMVNDLPVAESPVLQLSRDVTSATPMPTRYGIAINPNPFNPRTQVEYTIPEDAGTVDVSLRIYDISGRLVRTLKQSRQAAGRYTEVWNGRDDQDQQLASGVYFVRIHAGRWSQVEKVSLLK